MIDEALVRKIVEFLAIDISSTKPKFACTIFSGHELFETIGVPYNYPVVMDTMRFLSSVHYICQTEKEGPHGTYYNVTPHLYLLVHPVVRAKRFVNKQVDTAKGWCIVHRPEMDYRLSCEGVKCKFYYDSEKKCVQNKIFFLPDTTKHTY